MALVPGKETAAPDKGREPAVLLIEPNEEHQVLSTNPPSVYAGSPERIDFGEEQEAKGKKVKAPKGRN